MSVPEPEDDLDLVLRVLWGVGATDPRAATRWKKTSYSTYALLPRSDAVKALVPTWPPSVTSAVIRNYITPASPSGHLRAAALVLAARMGFSTLWPHVTHVRAHRETRGLVDHLADLLSRELVVGVFLGPRRVNRKPVLQLLTPEGDLVAFAKVGINDLTRRRVANETDALKYLNQLTMRTMSVPRLLADGSWHGSRFVVLAPVSTQSDAAPRDEWRRAAMSELSRSSGVETVPLVDASWWQEMIAGLDRSTAPGAEHLHALALRLADCCGHRVLELGAAHGDWSPWNMAIAKGRVVVWDWERFRRGVPIGWDAIHFTAQSYRKPRARADAGIRRMIGEASSITRDCGSASNDPRLVLATYLLDLGQRYVVDGQATGIQPRGPIAEWLLDPLTELVRSMTDGSAL